jgi:cytoskeletal protein CcmA (bactofilin family)
MLPVKRMTWSIVIVHRATGLRRDIMAKMFYRIVIVLTLVLLLVIGTASPALAFEERTGTNVTIGAGEVINSDLYIAGQTVNIDGTVNGDVFVIAQTITIRGTVNGGVSMAGQNITVNGRVSNGVRLAGQSIEIGANIGRDLVAAASDVTINQPAVIGGDANINATNVVLNGHVVGNVTGSIRTMTISGIVDQSVRITVSSLTLNSTANINGDLVYTSENTAAIASGAVISGATSQVAPPPEDDRFFNVVNGVVAGILGRVYGFLAIFIIGLVLIFTFTRRIKQLTLSLRFSPVSCLGWGALIFFVTPIAAIIVMFTVIGIPLGLISLTIWGILLYLAQIPVALVIGWLILSRGQDITSKGLLTGALALGLFILYVISAIPIFGGIMWFFVILFGLGTLVAVFRASSKNYLISATM